MRSTSKSVVEIAESFDAVIGLYVGDEGVIEAAFMMQNDDGAFRFHDALASEPSSSVDDAVMSLLENQMHGSDG